MLPVASFSGSFRSCAAASEPPSRSSVTTASRSRRRALRRRPTAGSAMAAWMASPSRSTNGIVLTGTPPAAGPGGSGRGGRGPGRALAAPEPGRDRLVDELFQDTEPDGVALQVGHPSQRRGQGLPVGGHVGQGLDPGDGLVVQGGPDDAEPPDRPLLGGAVAGPVGQLL